MAGKTNEKWMTTMIAKHGGREAVTEWVKSIGSIGGKTPTKTPKGFAADRERARRAGVLGGRISRRGKKLHA